MPLDCLYLNQRNGYFIASTVATMIYMTAESEYTSNLVRFLIDTETGM